MEIHCFAAIPLEKDEPVPAIRHFVRLLRDSAISTDRAEVDVKLISSSVRGRTAIQEFRPDRAKGAPFARSLEIAEELTSLGAAQIKSLHFLLSAEGFRWKGSSQSSSAKLALLDCKSLHRKQRFTLSAHLIFEASVPQESFIGKMLAEIAAAAGIHFQVQDSLMRVQPNEPGRATAEEFLVTVLSWMELIEGVEERVRERISLAGVPHLMTTYEAQKFLFDPSKLGKSTRVDFTRIVRKWLSEEFPKYTRYGDALDGELLYKGVAEGVVATLGVDKKPKAFSKEFTVALGVGLTSTRFAPAPDRPVRLAVNLFRLFGIAPLPMKWTYYSEADLHEALQGASTLVKQVLAIFEPEAKKMERAHLRRIEEFAGPREVSAKEAYDLALPLVKAWTHDGGLMRIVSNAISGPYAASFPVTLPVLKEEGRLAINGGWWLQFHSRSKKENLYVGVPCRGHMTRTLVDAPEGHHFPSDVDQILRDGWIDSVEAMRIARAAIEPNGTKGKTGDIQQFELSSRANLTSVGTLRPPFRDGMFLMETSWRISFPLISEREHRITSVTVPAYGDGTAIVAVHAFDKHGLPIQA